MWHVLKSCYEPMVLIASFNVIFSKWNETLLSNFLYGVNFSKNKVMTAMIQNETFSFDNSRKSYCSVKRIVRNSELLTLIKPYRALNICVIIHTPHRRDSRMGTHSDTDFRHPCSRQGVVIPGTE